MIKRIIITGLLLITLTGCVQPDATRQFLTAQGYTHVDITGYRPFMKGEDDFFSTGFVARSPTGQRVSGAVTAGLFKGKTIRFD